MSAPKRSITFFYTSPAVYDNLTSCINHFLIENRKTSMDRLEGQRKVAGNLKS